MTLSHEHSRRPTERKGDSFLDGVDALERAASAPPVVGETVTWCRRVTRDMDRLEARLRERRRRHDRLRDELAREAPADVEKIESTAASERRLGSQLAGLRHRLDELIETGEEDGFDEPYQEAKKARVALLAWCVAARSIDAEIRARVMETYYRDRGTVD